jgi:hypothetical protein
MRERGSSSAHGHKKKTCEWRQDPVLRLMYRDPAGLTRGTYRERREEKSVEEKQEKLLTFLRSLYVQDASF